jgi:flagellar protein FliJ
MKAFEFRLERIAQYRRQQAELAQARFQALLSELRRLEGEIASLDIQSADVRREVTGRPGLSGADLEALDQYQRHLARQATALARKKPELAADVEAQRAVVIEVERQVKLLERLRERKFQEWSSEADRELESLAAESYISRLAARRNDVRP